MRKSLANMSSGEAIIYRLLKDNNIKFERELTFPGCKRQFLLPFDFCLKDYLGHEIILVEFDGEQHYYPIWGGVEGHSNVKRNDAIKNRYCLINDIPLIRIPYWEKDNITIDFLNPKKTPYLVKEIQHNAPYYITHQQFVNKRKKEKEVKTV